MGTTENYLERIYHKGLLGGIERTNLFDFIDIYCLATYSASAVLVG